MRNDWRSYNGRNKHCDRKRWSTPTPAPSTHAADYRQHGVTFNSGSSMSVVAFVGYTTPGSSSFINVDIAQFKSVERSEHDRF